MDNTSEIAEKDKLIENLREANSELARQLQHFKITAAQKDNDNIELLREITELRLQLCKIRTTGADNAQQLDTAIQSGCERTLQHLYQASNIITRTVQLAKQYFQEQRKLETELPRWSTINNTPSEKVHRVPPMMGGRSIQPVVALSRSILNNISDDSATTQRNLNQSHNTGNRAVPMHLLQDVYIPLTRIDVPNNSMDNGVDTDDVAGNNEDEEENAVDPEHDLFDEMLNLNASRILHAVAEDLEPSDADSPRRMDDPMEGPSWMLDNPRVMLNKCETPPMRHVFTPTMRRRPRGSPSPPPRSPLAPRTPKNLTQGTSQLSPHTPRTPHTPHSSRVFQRVTSPKRKNGFKFRNNENGRVLKVMVPKMRLDIDDDENGGGGDGDRNGVADGDEDEGGASPPKRPSIDAPSPQGSTDAAVVVLPSATAVVKTKKRTQKSRSQRQRALSSDSRKISDNDNHDSDSRSDSSDSRGERDSRSRRTRKAITYREIPLNRKMRR